MDTSSKTDHPLSSIQKAADEDDPQIVPNSNETDVEAQYTPKYTEMALKGKHIIKHYDDNKVISRKKSKVLNDVNISIQKGKIYGLLGPSGCGKTTLLKSLIGLLDIDGGTVYVDDELRNRKPGHIRINLNKLGFMPQESCLISELTITETFYYYGKLYLMSNKAIKERRIFLLKLLDLPNPNAFVSSLSGGQLRRVSFAVCLINKPKLLMLDEPTVGMDPVLRKKIWNYLLNLSSDENTTIIITTHYIEEARRAHRLGFMRFGRIIEENDPHYFINKYQQSILEEIFYSICVESQTQAVKTDSTTDSLLEDKKKPLAIEQDKSNGVPAKPTLASEEKPHHHDSCSIDIRQTSNVNKCSSHLNECFINRFLISGPRLKANFFKDYLKTKRNYKLLFIQIFVPIIQITFFCLCIGQRPKNLPIGLINYETTDDIGLKMGDRFIGYLDNTTLNKRVYSDFESGYQDLKAGKLAAVIKIDDLFSNGIVEAVTHPSIKHKFENMIHIYMDASNQQIAFTIRDSVMTAAKSLADSFLSPNVSSDIQKFRDIVGFEDEDEKSEHEEATSTPDGLEGEITSTLEPTSTSAKKNKTHKSFYPFVFEKPVYGSENPLYVNFMAPGVALSVLYFLSVASTATNFEIERQTGVLQRSYLAGVKTIELLVSQLIVYSVMMFVQVVIVLGLLFGAFGLTLNGSLLLITSLVFSEGFCGLCYGLAIASIFDGIETILQVTLASFYPVLLMSGVIWPIEAQPKWLIYISKISPVTYPAEAFRCILEKGWDLTYFPVLRGFITIYAWMLVYSIVFLYVFSQRSVKMKTLF